MPEDGPLAYGVDSGPWYPGVGYEACTVPHGKDVVEAEALEGVPNFEKAGCVGWQRGRALLGWNCLLYTSPSPRDRG